MKTKFSVLLFLLFFSFNIQAQLPDGSTAPNITFTDIDGNTHTLYDILDEGKSVVFDVMATWCGPCWNYHNTHVLRDLYEDYGPAGSNEIEIFMVESSTSTNEACLYGTSGCSGGTFGDWTDDTPYPIVHITSGNGGSFNSDFNIAYFPTLYKICPNRKIYEVGQPPLGTWENWITSCNLDATEQVTNVICYGEGDTGIDLTTEGGYGSISYAWSNGASTEDLMGVAPGSYSCTITEGQGHSIEIGPFEIDGPSSPLIVDIVSESEITCAGDDSGSIFTSSSGGGTNYTYQWSNGANTPDLINIPGGLYVLSVTDSYGCTETVTTFISEPPALNLNTDVINENCDQSNGALLLFVNGGEGSYIYDIGNGPTSNNVISDLAAGNYTATVTDENGCTITSTSIIENTPGPLAEAGESETISCTDATINLNGTGSSTGNDISYSWETQDGNIISGANTLFPVIDQPGTYTLSVINFETGCQTDDEVIVEGDLNTPESDAGDDDSLTCISTTATLNGSNSSEGDQFEYLWINENGDELGSDIEITVDEAGIYDLIVTNIDNGCSASSSVEVTADTQTPNADAGDADQITCAVTNVNLDASNSSEGNQFEYLWLDQNQTEIGTDIEVTVEQAGTYELIVTNNDNGCSATSSVEVSEDTQTPNADAGSDDQITCAVTSIDLDASNSSEGNQFEYSWLDQNQNEIGTDIEVNVEQAGTYELIVTNNDNGCSATSSVEVSEDTQTPNANAGNDDQITCAVTSIDLDASNSSEGSQFEYSWLDQNQNEIGTDIEVNVEQAGTYELIVTNSDNGCSATSSVEVSEDTQTPNADAGNDDQITCTITNVNLDASNSSEGSQFEYSWLDQNQNEIGTDIEVNVEQAGIYELIVTNNDNGCSATSSVEVSEDTQTPNADAGDADQITCDISTVNLDASNSSEGSQFEYSWLDQNQNEIGTDIEVNVEQAGTYELIVTNNDNGCSATSSVEVSEDTQIPNANAGNDDQITCAVTSINLDASNSSEGNQFEYLWLDQSGNEISSEIEVTVEQVGIYELIVSNNDNGCFATASVEVSEDTQIPNADAGNDNQITCAVTNVNLDASNSSEGNEFEYLWLDQSGNEIGTDIEVTVEQAGIYNLIVSNNDNGCSATASVQVSQDIDTPIADAGSDGQLDCEISSIELDGSNSSTGDEFEYTWLNSNNTNVGNNITVEISDAETYTLVVTNTQNGCTTSAQVEVTASTDFPIVEVQADGLLTCTNNLVLIDGEGSDEGSNYDYQWLNENDEEIGTGISIEVNTSGSYTFLVTDSDNGCSASSNIIIEQDITSPIAEIAEPDILDCINTSTILDASNSSANGILAFEWYDVNNNSIGNEAFLDVSNIGLYNLIVTNTENGCSTSTNTQVTASNDLPTAAAEVLATLTCINESVIVSAASSSANGSINYSWQNEAGIIIGTTQDIEVSNEGTYTLIITDIENGCSASTSIAVESSNDIPTALANVNGTLTCVNESVSISGSSSTTSVAYSWENANGVIIGNNSNIDINAAGTYTLIVTDPETGCSASTSVIVDSNTETPTALANIDGMLTCTNTSVNISGSSSSTSANYSWENENGVVIGNNPDVEVSDAGIYTLIVTDQNNGCISTSTVEVFELSEPVLSLNSIADVVCFGGTDGSASLSINGGLAPYTYNWSNGATGAEVNNLSAGTYTVIATDDAGCQSEIEVVINQNNPITVQIDQLSNNTCPNDTQGAIDISVSGGADGYTFEWSNGMNTEDIGNLESGTYTLLITDQSGCQTTQQIDITSTDDIIPIAMTQNITIALDENGLAIINANMLDNGTTDNCGIDYFSISQESFDCSQLGQNEVIFEVTDFAGNTATQTTTVTIIDDLAPSISCIENIVSNSCQSIEYTLPSASDNCMATEPVLIEGLPSGAAFPEGTTMITYQVEDMAGNIATCSFSITVENTLESTFDVDPVTCFEESTGSITALPNGGTPGYTYLWNTGATTQMISDITAGTYSVIITDEAGCQFEEMISLDQPMALEISTDNIINETEMGNDGGIEVSISGGTAPYNYQWTDPNGNIISNEEDLSGVPNGIYILTVIDANGCSILSEEYLIDVIIATTNLDFEKYIKISPNPTSGEVSVNIELETPMQIQLSVLDVTGKVLLAWNKENVSTRNYDLNLTDFPNGVYLARVILEGEVYVQKIILAKK